MVLSLVELLEPGEVLIEPMLPLEADGLSAEFGLVAELFEALIGPEGEVAARLLSVAEPVLGLVALFDPMLLELPAVEPLAPESWAKTVGMKAATNNARPAPSK